MRTKLLKNPQRDTKTVRRKIKRIIVGSTIPQKLFRVYFLTVLIGAILLYCPFSLNNGYIIDGVNDRRYTFWDSLFIACSAFSDTGLTPATLSWTFNAFGQVVIMFLIEFGGIGVVAIVFLIWNAFRKENQVNINHIIILQGERGNTKVGGSFNAIKKAVLFIIVTETIFAILIAFWLCFSPAYKQSTEHSIISYDTDELVEVYGDFARSLWVGIFTSVSAINNAGFDIFDGNWSLASYRNDWNMILPFMTMIEFVIGGIGFPVIFDLIEKRKHKRKGMKYRMSLFTKVALWTYIGVALSGILLVNGFELIDKYMNPEGTNDMGIFTSRNFYGQFGNVDWLNREFAIIYNCMSSRSAGFTTLDNNVLVVGSQWSTILLMFIGGGPSSTAGGIRTTTLAVMIAAVFAKIRGRHSVNMFKKKIPLEKVKDSFIVMFVAAFLVLLISILVQYSPRGSWTEESFDFVLIQTIYECSSAFGTVGLSVGITPNIGSLGLIAMIVLMFVGQLGVSSTLLSWTKKEPRGNRADYPEEDLRIG